MPENQYHEPPEELSDETRTFARMAQSLIEEVEAINWYEQRISVETDKQARAIMQNAQEEEFKHFGLPLLVSVSRKGFLRRLVNRRIEESGPASLAVCPPSSRYVDRLPASPVHVTTWLSPCTVVP